MTDTRPITKVDVVNPHTEQRISPCAAIRVMHSG